MKSHFSAESSISFAVTSFEEKYNSYFLQKAPSYLDVLES